MRGPHEPRLDPRNPTPELLLAAYAEGLFPMAEPETGRIGWYSPDPRGILPLADFHLPRNLARTVRGRRFQVEADRDFAGVMTACGPGRVPPEPTWIDGRLIRAYTALNEAGHAHSVEARRDGVLVGGLYGVVLGGAFFGESMFVRPDLGGTGASQVCLGHLVAHLRRRGFELLDTQFLTAHLARFGGREIPREAYLRRLRRAIGRPVRWAPWTGDGSRGA